MFIQFNELHYTPHLIGTITVTFYQLLDTKKSRLLICIVWIHMYATKLFCWLFHVTGSYFWLVRVTCSLILMSHDDSVSWET